MGTSHHGAALAALAFMGAGHGAARAEDCAGLARLTLPDLHITEAVLAPAAADLPASCRVKATASTGPASSVRVEVWMPASGWNKRFLATGWAFYAGTMNPAILAGPLRRGYATATTDGGGAPGDPAFFLGRPDKVKDWGERAWHVTTVAAKAVIRAYYGEGPAYAYWSGGGGASRQGLKEAQRFPADYDGIVVGGLAHDTSHFAFAQVAQWRAVHDGGPVRAETLPALHAAAVAACDAGDGMRDGLIGDPERCAFDPAAIACKDARVSAACLTPVEVAAFRKLYAPVVAPRSGREIFGGLARGSEPTWKGLIEAAAPQSYAVDFFRYIVFQDPAWDHRSLDLDRDLARAEAVDPAVNGTDPDLGPFFAHGGKLIVWGGWSDSSIPPGANTGYWRSVVGKLGAGRTNASMRLFMVPGMAHFPGRTGEDAVDFDTQPLIEAWREEGRAPARLVATRWSGGVQGASLIVCPYPALAAPAADCRNPQRAPR
jgi:feruloyl esterase